MWYKCQKRVTIDLSTQTNIITMNRHDNIELILQHAIEQGDYSQLYLERLASMTDAEIEVELDRLEQIAM